MKLMEQLARERQLADDSEKRWDEELRLFTELTDFYDRLCAAAPVSSREDFDRAFSSESPLRRRCAFG